AKLNDCRCVFQPTYKNRQGGLFVTGFKEDVDRTREICFRLDAHMLHSMRGKQVNHGWKLSFLDGYYHAVISRLSKARAESKRTAEQVYETKTMALALVDKDKQVEDAYNDRWTNLRTTKSRGPKNFNGAGYSAGVAAGNSANLANGSIGSGR